MIKHTWLKKQYKMSFVVVLLGTVGLLSFVCTPSCIEENTHNDLITPVFASRDLPSFSPRAVRSGSGRIHLIFLHYFQEYDFGSYKPYHTYELEDGSWSPPEKVIDDHIPSIFTIKPKANGLVIYYNRGIGVYMKEFDEQRNKWSDPVKLFRNTLMGSVDSFFLFNNDSFFVAWDSYMITRVEANGSFTSQVIQGSGIDDGYGTFVNTPDSLYFYYLGTSAKRYYYLNKTVLLPNGTWSNWQASNFVHSLLEIFGGGKLTTSLVADHYVICYATDKNGITKWGIVDLATDNLTAKLLNLPHKLDTSKQYDRIAIELLMNDHTQPLFMTAFLTNRTIELWEYDYEDNIWSQMSVLEYPITESFLDWTVTQSYQPAPFNIDLIPDGANWRIFWDQHITGKDLLYEIFTVTYNPVTQEWGSVTQITDTRTITDDYIGDTPGYTFVIVVVTLLMAIILLKKHKIRKK